MTMVSIPLTLTTFLVIFLLGFLLHRHASVKIAAIGCFVLGALVAANPVVHTVVHTLAEAFNTLA